MLLKRPSVLALPSSFMMSWTLRKPGHSKTAIVSGCALCSTSHWGVMCFRNSVVQARDKCPSRGLSPWPVEEGLTSCPFGVRKLSCLTLLMRCVTRPLASQGVYKEGNRTWREVGPRPVIAYREAVLLAVFPLHRGWA